MRHKNIIIALAALLCIGGIAISVTLNFNLGVLLSLLFFTAFYLTYNYYFCYFSGFYKKSEVKETICVQLKDATKVWPKIRKGEIYELLPAEKQNDFGEEISYTIAMAESIKKEK